VKTPHPERFPVRKTVPPVPTNPERFPPVRKTLPPVPKLTEAVETLTTDDVYKRADDLSEEFHRFVEECQHEHPEMTQLDRIFQGWMLQKLALIQLIIERIVNASPKSKLTNEELRKIFKWVRKNPDKIKPR
jgi:hypothetical protein